MEVGSWKLEDGRWKMENEEVLQLLSSFSFSIFKLSFVISSGDRANLKSQDLKSQNLESRKSQVANLELQISAQNLESQISNLE